MRKLSVLIALFLVFATVGSALAIDVEMAEQNNSGQSGTVTLEAVGDNQTRVTIQVSPGAAGVQQPAHIHEGTCEDLNPQPKFPLNPVIDGMSETVVNASLETIQASQHAVNVHLSPQEASTYVSCGTIPVVAMAGTPAAGTPAAMQPAAGTPQPAATPTTAATPTAETMAPATGTPRADLPAGTPAARVSPTPSGLPSAGGIPIELIAFSGSALLALGAAAAYANRRR